jgi:predicted  nucleic acid-binding Zn-ribbon protein
MRVDLAQLVELQNLDLKIAEIQGAVHEIPKTIADMERRFIASRKELDEAKEAMAQLEKSRRLKEGELKQVEQQVKERQGRLWEIRKNEEYQAVLKEIEILKGRQSTLEEEILMLFDRTEEAGKIVAAREAEFKAREADFHRDRMVKEGELKRLQEEFHQLQEERGRQVQQVEPGLFHTYQRLLRSRGGVAVVSVKDGSCLGCYVALTPQTYNELRKGETFITCANCQRILYWTG